MSLCAVHRRYGCQDAACKGVAVDPLGVEGEGLGKSAGPLTGTVADAYASAEARNARSILRSATWIPGAPKK